MSENRFMLNDCCLQPETFKMELFISTYEI